jgi:hypothetical protein
VKPSSFSRALAALVVVAVLAVPAVAAAESHTVRFNGSQGVSFTVLRYDDGAAPAIERLSYAHRSGFERVRVEDGSFKTCLRVHHAGTYYYDHYCIHGTFQTPDYVTGEVTNYYVQGGTTHTEKPKHFEARPEQ